MKRIVISLAVLGLVAAVVMSATTYKEVYFPTTRGGEAFWASGTGRTTYTNEDSLTGTNIWTSKPFSLVADARDWTGGGSAPRNVTANELVFYGTLKIGLGPSFCDSIEVQIVGIANDGDSCYTFAADTVALDTTALGLYDGTATGNGRLSFFQAALTPTDKKGNTLFPQKAHLAIRSIETTANDTLFLDDCGVLIRWKE